MPLTLTLTEGVLPPGSEKIAVARITDAMLKWHGLTGNKLIIHELSGGKQPKNNIYVNVLHAVDGAWNFEGRALTNAEMAAEVAKG